MHGEAGLPQGTRLQRVKEQGWLVEAPRPGQISSELSGALPPMFIRQNRFVKHSTLSSPLTHPPTVLFEASKNLSN